MKSIIRPDQHIEIVLSKRNLLTLLSKLEWPDSAKTITDGDIYVRAESDEIHYKDRDPGPMHPRTEIDLLLNKVIGND